MPQDIDITPIPYTDITEWYENKIDNKNNQDVLRINDELKY